MSLAEAHRPDLPLIKIDVIEHGGRGRPGRYQCEIGQQLKFSTKHLESYCMADWKPIVFDLLLLAAAIEFCDRVQRRPLLGWGREIELRLPVHDVSRWRSKSAFDCLHAALNLLTGDRWRISFVPRKKSENPPRQGRFDLPGGSLVIIPFSDGLDSRAVAGLVSHEIGNRLIRVRLGSKRVDRPVHEGRAVPFTSIPYRVIAARSRFVETSGRSRGFKFALISGIAAYLTGAHEVIVPESGQGALGPVLVPVGHGYEDYRNHPVFTRRMEAFFSALLGHVVHFRFPRLWFTKAETLQAFTELPGATWVDTRSCWQQSRHVSVDHHRRQCGICAACMLRRLTVHAAGLTEPRDTYVWENLSAPNLEQGAAAGFNKIGKAQRQYALAGVLHLDHLAGLRNSPVHAVSLRRNAFRLSEALAIPQSNVVSLLDRLLQQHESEWAKFRQALGVDSFVAAWSSQHS